MTTSEDRLENTAGIAMVLGSGIVGGGFNYNLFDNFSSLSLCVSGCVSGSTAVILVLELN